MQPIEVTAKKVDDAIREGLRLLGTTLDKVEYKVISSGGLFKKAKISIRVIDDESDKKVKKPQEIRHQEVKSDADNICREEKNADSRPKNGSQPVSFQKDAQQNHRERAFVSVGAQKSESQPVFSKESAQKPFPAKQEREFDKQQKPSRFKHELSETSDIEIKKRVRTQVITETNVKNAADFISELIRLMGIETEIKTDIIDGDLVIDLASENGALIGYRGEILDALEYLVSVQVNRDNDEYINIVVDSCGYRKKREKMLITMAERSANRCIKIERKVIMEPMNRNSRKIVHSALSNYDNITSKSEGTEPNRHIVIYFKRGRNGKE